MVWVFLLPVVIAQLRLASVLTVDGEVSSILLVKSCKFEVSV